jgi:tRNA threonylcarbamoyl adenosine modification protein YjeE
MTYKIPLYTLQDTQNIAVTLASCLPAIGVVTFFGDMGAGKTTFIARLIESLYKNASLNPPIITSPTFSLVHEYCILDKKIAHFDLFRLKNPDEVLNLGFDDYLDTALCLIEWAENAQEYLGNVILNCTLTVENDRRILTLCPVGGYSLDNKKFDMYKI